MMKRKRHFKYGSVGMDPTYISHRMSGALAKADVFYQVSVWQHTHAALHPTGKGPLPVPGIDLVLIHFLQHILPESGVLFGCQHLEQPFAVARCRPGAHVNVVELPRAPPSSPRPNMNVRRKEIAFFACLPG